MEQFLYLYQEWRKKLNNAALLVASITLLLEIIVSFLLIRYVPEKIGLPLPSYILNYIFLPSLGNFLLVLIGRYIMYSKRFSEISKNYFSILILTTQVFIIACVHNVFIFTITLFIVPIMLTVIYSNNMITNIVTLVSIVLLSISSLVAITDTQTNDMFHSIEIFIAIILFIGCNLITNFINDIEKDKNDIIKAGAFKQLQLEELIKCDPLTGLYNMSSFYNMLDATIKNSEMPLSIAVIDIDNFKSVNDTWGHEKANEVLIYIAAQLQACCSTYGYVFRYGGEEFTIVFPYITPTQAKAMIEIAQDNIYQHDFDTIPQQKITFSCGIAAYSSSEYNAHDFFQLADKIMYQAKFSGKNKILIGSA